MRIAADATADRELVISRIIEATPEDIFDAFTDRDRIGDWFGPDGFRTTTKSMDPRPGGAWIFTMHGPDGTDYPNAILYIELDRPHRIVYDQGTSPNDIWFRSTITLQARGDKTEITLRSVFSTAEVRNMVVEKYGAIEGGKQTLARLAAYVEDA